MGNYQLNVDGQQGAWIAVERLERRLQASRILGSMTTVVVVMAVLSLAPVEAAGQVPQGLTKTWDPRRTADGKPDMQGFWERPAGINSANIEGGAGRKGVVVEPPDGKIPLQPWAAAIKRDIIKHEGTPKLEHIDPSARCWLPGVPRQIYAPYAYQILQRPGYVVILSEFVHAYRVVRLDGRPHVGENIKLYMGDSRGRWEDNTLVVDVTNFNDKTRFDIAGTIHSNALHVVERWTLVASDTIQYEATIDDPKVFTRPWKIAFPISRVKERNFELMEYACYEGNDSIMRHMLDR